MAMNNILVNANQQIAQEEETLLRLFPAEVWNMIFLHCDVSSMFLLSNSSQSFRNWFLSKRTAYLFPLVWMVLKANYLNLWLPEFLKIRRSALNQEKSTQLIPESLQVPSENRCQMPPRPHTISSSQRFCDHQRNLRTILRGVQSTLKLRLVCTHWCETISATHLEKLDKEKMDIQRILENQPTGSLVPWMETKLKANFNLEKFEQMIFMDFSKSRFVARAIVIENYNATTYNVLEQIGHEVWYCTMLINSRDEAVGRSAVYLNIRNLLKLLPNLKSLEIEKVSVRENFFIFQEEDEQEEEEDPLQAQQLLRVINQNPIEKLENLQVLQAKYLSCQMFNELVRSNHHIKTLEVGRDADCGEYNMCKELLSSLEELSIHRLTDSDLEMLSQPFVDWKLKKIYLDVEAGLISNWDSLFELFNGKWKETKVNVRCCGNEWEGVGNDFALGFWPQYRFSLN